MRRREFLAFHPPLPSTNTTGAANQKVKEKKKKRYIEVWRRLLDQNNYPLPPRKIPPALQQLLLHPQPLEPTQHRERS
jgi:ribosome maturation protein Sdo1